MNVETANRLQNLRKKNGYSQEELAEKIGISRQAVSKWERAEASPDTDNLILLARLYGVTLDELLNTESVPLPNSEGISLSKEFYTSGASDDGEIYPEGHPKYVDPNAAGKAPSGAASENAANTENKTENSANSTEKSANGANSDTAASVGGVVRSVAGVIGDAIDTAAVSVREGKANSPKDGSDNGKSYADAFEKNFKGFGERMKDFGKNFDKNMDEWGKSFEKDMDEWGKNLEKSVESAVGESKAAGEAFYDREKKHEERKEKHKKVKEKYPATLLDKLFPFFVTMLFLFTVFEATWAVEFSWLVFFSIPVYYIFSDAVKSVKHKKSDPLHALKSFLDGSLPILVVFLFLTGGLLAEAWVPGVFLFALIPIYYIFSANLFSFIDGKKPFRKAVKNFLDACVPIIVLMIFFILMFLGFQPSSVLIFAFIPIYYIVSGHFAKR